MTGSAEAKVRELGLDLSAAPAPTANYVRAVTAGRLVYLAGHGPRGGGTVRVQGKLGRDMDVDEGYETARSVGVQLLSSLKAEVGDLDRVERVVKLLCMVNCTPDFGEHPQVANGCSDLLVEVFGESGRHARSAVGMAGLPNGIPVEIEAIFLLRE
ncbi:MAG: RidA family protein [Dehalococcoidia bacterium]|nr:RidA family protein [Dehalococcoidia bacterium]